MLLHRLPPAATILDVCCGNGVIARELTRRGYRVTGVDSSEEMLRHARRNSPFSRFVLGDARTCLPGSGFRAAISTFDSLNHILSSGELGQVFQNVRAALAGGGLFLFDVNLEERYMTAWNETCSDVGDRHACFIRGSYDPNTRLGRTEITLFEQHGSWERFDVTLLQRYHPADQVISLLHNSGFTTARAYNAVRDLGLEGTFGEGRAVFLAGT